jgi:hypothetical protein
LGHGPLGASAGGEAGDGSNDARTRTAPSREYERGGHFALSYKVKEIYFLFQSGYTHVEECH